ncbi:MAG: cation-transporting P-type ATPase [Thermodesulfovibrionales bacterium]|nr:cation-transporting P-type ATPase [Thermodesulfovibrionales bacterium]
MVSVIHNAVQGRVRLKIKCLYRSEQTKLLLEKTLSNIPDICGFKINTLTANVLILYHNPITLDTIIKKLETALNTNKQEYKNHNPEKPKVSQSNITKSRRRIRKLVLDSEEQIQQPFYTYTKSEILTIFQTDVQHGLSTEKANELLKKYGPNILPESVPRSGWSIFINQFKSLPVALLGFAAGVSAFTGGIMDALIIAGVVVINSLIGYFTEMQAERTIHSLKSLVKPNAFVKRDGKIKEIPAEDIVPGDVIVLKPGSYVSADARLLESTHLSVDESALTGESMPVMKNIRVINNINTPIADRLNMVYMGTLVTGGQGIALVVNTGRFTEIGKIQTLVGEAKPPETPMEIQLEKIGTQLVYISSFVCMIVFLIGLLRGYGLLEMFKIAISLAVAAVPEGLPTVATTTLALGIKNMRRHNVLIRRLDAVETLGSVQCICLDKTGTLTLNKMTVVSIFSGMKYINIDNNGFYCHNELINPLENKEIESLLKVSVLCNESEIENNNGNLIIRGSSTENALIYSAITAGMDVKTIRKQYPLQKIRHRSENCNIMVTMHKNKVDAEYKTFVAIKGSPNEVLALCDWHISDGEIKPLTDDDRLTIMTENEHMAGRSLRLLGMAYGATGELEGCEQPIDLCDICELPVGKANFIWLGLTGMIDPIRDGVKNLIHSFHQAGIDTIMITGDQVPTAYSIGKELNLNKDEQLEILDSTHLSEIEPELLTALAQKVHVFARVSPANKLQIVQALQSANKVVAMTGDGINDGPALKAADIGIALGHTGTDVAREVADVVIEDDNLETMIVAIRQGRTIYNNIRKSVRFLLSTNMSEIMVMFTCISTGIGQPLNTMQLLWINLLSDIAPGLALSMEEAEPDIMRQPPRDPTATIISTSDFKRITFEASTITLGSLASYIYGIARYGAGARANSLAFLTLTLTQMLHAISCRSDKNNIFSEEKLKDNKYLKWSIGGSFLLQFLAFLIPPLRGILGITPIGIIDTLVVGATTVTPFLINESTKLKTKNF